MAEEDQGTRQREIMSENNNPPEHTLLDSGAGRDDSSSQLSSQNAMLSDIQS